MRRFLIKLLKREVLQELVKDLYNTIGADDILNTNGEWTVEDKEVPPQIQKQLISEAHIFKGTRLWKEMQKDIKYKSNKLMYIHSETPNDLLLGKAWLYILDCQKTFLKRITK